MKKLPSLSKTGPSAPRSPSTIFVKVGSTTLASGVESAIEGEGGVPAGCQFDRDSVLWVADMRLGVLKVSQTGEFTQVGQVDSEKRRMQGCNDCVFDYEGNLWVTAPAGEIAPHPYRRSMEEPFGSVYCVVSKEDIRRVDTGLRFPNGIAVQHLEDGRPQRLIVAETPTKSLWAYTILGPGQLGPRTLWGKLPGSLEGGPDGMDFDADDNLLVAHWGSGHIEVFGPQGGAPVQRVKCPFARVSNLHFQPGAATVLVTEHDNHGLWKFQWERPGKLQYCETLIF